MQNKITNFINKCKETNKINSIMTLKINNNIQIWVQWYFNEYNIELQVKDDNEEFFENCININEIYYNQEIKKYLRQQKYKLKKLGIKEYLKQNQEHFL